MKNLIVNIPQVGDILFLDENKNKNFIAGSTFDLASFLPTNEIVGVVAVRQGNQLIIVNKNNESKQWAETIQWIVDGWILDGVEHKVTFGFHSSRPAASTLEYIYKASTIEEIIPSLNAWFDNYYKECKKLYRAEQKDKTTIVVRQHKFNSWTDYTFSMSGLNLTLDLALMLPANTNTYAKNGIGSYYKGVNFKRYYEIISTATSGTFNPTTPLTSLGSIPISLKCYLSDVGKFARDIYGEGESGYKKYLQDYMVDFPAQRGALSPSFNSGKDNTYALSKELYTAENGERSHIYTAAHYCSEIGYPSEGLRKGNWFLPSMQEMLKIWSQLTYGTAGVSIENADPINKALKAIGGKTISLSSSAWSSCRCYRDSAWYYSSSGYTNDGYMCSSLMCVPCCALDLSESEPNL